MREIERLASFSLSARSRYWKKSSVNDLNLGSTASFSAKDTWFIREFIAKERLSLMMDPMSEVTTFTMRLIIRLMMLIKSGTKVVINCDTPLNKPETICTTGSTILGLALAVERRFLWF